jgi:DNA mismatch repair protein MutS2
LYPFPDLLFSEPDGRVDTLLLERALVFGFSAGDTNRAFERALEQARCPGSSFEEASFARDLFVDDFIDKCLRVRVAGKAYTPCRPYLHRVLCNPSPDIAIALQRQAVLRALIDDATTRTQLEALYGALAAFRETLASGDFSARVDPNQRRLEILKSFSALMRLLVNFRDQTSVLGRLFEFGQAVIESPGFEFLEELLQYEESRAHVDVRLQLGSDGSVRNFEIVQHETAPNAFQSSWFAQLWHRVTLMVKGYRVTENEVLSRLIFRAFEGVKDAIPPLFQLLGDIEFFLGALHLWEHSANAGYKMAFPSIVEPSCSLPTTFVGLFNPFLVADGTRAVRADISAQSSAITILTGPNSGGKTRLMQALALAQLLAQCGLPVPAEQAQVNRARGLFVSMFEEVRADQPEGRLGMELLRIRRLFEKLHPGDVVVLDELCSGTNPSEGEEIFQLVLELIAQLKPQVWISTHFLQLAQLLQSEQAKGHHALLSFLRVCLDPDERPTYRFEPGVANTSLAHQTAARLGVTRSELQRLVTLAQTRNA